MFKKPTKKFKDRFDQLVSSSQSIVVTSHTSPDDDSVASSLSVFAYISNKFPYKHLRIIYTGEPTSKYTSFKFFDKVQFVDDLANHLSSTDLLIMLDGSQYSRFSSKPELLQKPELRTICIDHHSSPIDRFTLTLVNTTSPSNVENIYNLFYRDDKISQPEIEIILLGILGDTGIFAYLKPDQTGTFDVVKRLIREGNVEIQEFLSRYSSIEERTFEIVKELVLNTKNLHIQDWPSLTVTFISRAWFEEGKFTDTQRTDATHLYMSSYLRLIKGYTWGFIVSPKKDGSCGVSLRSLPGSVKVRDMMEKMKIGGGHDRAAGGTLRSNTPGKKLESVEGMDMVFDWMAKNPAPLS